MPWVVVALCEVTCPQQLALSGGAANAICGATINTMTSATVTRYRNYQDDASHHKGKLLSDPLP